MRVQLLLLLIFTYGALTSYSIELELNYPPPTSFPFLILNKQEISYTLDSTPAFDVNVQNNSNHIFKLKIDDVRGVRCVERLETRVTRLQRLKDVNNTITVKNYSLNDPNLWKINYGENNDTRSMLYSANLPNGALVTIQMYINNASYVEVEVPRANNTCVSENNCSCDPTHNITLNSLKMNIGVKNWTFAAQNQKTPYQYLVFGTTLTGPFDIESYFTGSSEGDVSVCNVYSLPLALNSKDFGRYRAPMSFFDNLWMDGRIVLGVTVAVDVDAIQVLPNGEVQFPIYILFLPFENEMLYDPDLSVLLDTSHNGGGGGGGEGSEAVPGAGDGGSEKGALSTAAVVGIVIGVIAGAVVLGGVMVAMVVGVAYFIKTRMRTDLSGAMLGS